MFDIRYFSICILVLTIVYNANGAKLDTLMRQKYYINSIGNQLYMKHDSDELNSEFDTTNTLSNSADILYDSKLDILLYIFTLINLI